MTDFDGVGWNELNDEFYDNSVKFQNQLRFIETYHELGENFRTYIYDLKEYPSRIKKLFIKGNSEKKVPIQNLNIQTNTFETNNDVYYDRYIIPDPDNPGELKNDLDWAPKETFETGIQKTVQWYLDNETWWRRIEDGIYNQERLGLKKSN